MKKILLSITLTLTCLFPSTVFALTFNDGDKTYNLKEVEIKCSLDNLSYVSMDKNNNFIYENNEDGNKQTKILDDGTCSELDGQELLDYYNKREYYEIDKNSDDDYIIVRRNTEGVEIEDILIPTNDNEIDLEKEYYEIEVGDGNISYGPATSGNINNYYEYADLMLTKNIKQVIGKTYYEIYDNTYASVVGPDEYDESKATNYFVLSDGSPKTTSTTVLTLPKVFNSLFENANFFVLESNNNSYIVIRQSNEQKWDIYDIKGNMLFEDVDSMAAVNSLYAVTINNVTNFYNFDKELVYELKNSSVMVSKVNGNTSVIVGKKDQKDTLFILGLEEPEKESSNNADNPDTSDNIITMIILSFVSIIGIGFSLFYLNKKDLKSSN